MNHMTIEHVFASPYTLPGFLNRLGVTAEQLSKLAIAHSPQMVRALVMSCLKRSGKDAYCKARLRRLKPTHEEARAQCQSIIRKGDVNDKILAQKARDLVRDNELYDTPAGVKSRIVGGFSYGDTDYESELEMYRAVECPSCSNTEVVLADNPEDALEMAEKFTHLSGPYCRCERCEAVVRPTVEAATCLPDDYEGFDGDEHELYVEQLDYLLEQMQAHLDKLGLPKPARLYIGVTNADWQGRYAYARCSFDGKDLASKLRVNGDYMIRNGLLTIREDGYACMTCTLAHHDASSGITIAPEWDCDILGDGCPLYQENLEEGKGYARIAETLLTGEGEEFEYSNSGEPFSLVSHSGLSEGILELGRRLGYTLKPEQIYSLIEYGTDTPQLDLIAFNLFQLEDFVLIRKYPANMLEVQAVFTRRALDAYLATGDE